MEWFFNLMTNHESVAYTVIVYSVVIALGVALGKVRIGGISFGIACVLFAGIAAAHFGFTVNHEVQHFIKEFGLILFVYTIGLQVGPGFFASFQKEGLKLNSLAIIAVVCCVATVIAIHYLLDIDMPTLVGIMSGAVTNTPGLGAAQATVTDLSGGTISTSVLSTGYAVAYPFGVLGIIIVMLAMKSALRININTEKRLHNWKHHDDQSSIARIAIEIDNPALFGKRLSVINETLNFSFIISRVFKRNTSEEHLADNQIILEEKDVALIVCDKKNVEKLLNLMGKQVQATEFFSEDEKQMKIVSRRINVTQRSAYTKKLSELNVRGRFGVTITRVFRAGLEFIPSPNTKLQFGDTITVIGDEASIQLVSKEFGNSKKRMRTPHIAELFLGITLGVLVGSIPFHIPGIPVPVKLGLAGGPLIVAILISRYGGRLSVTHYVSQSANLMVREIGIVLFLASVGLDAGKTFMETILHGEGLYWMLIGALITLIPLIITALVSRFNYKLTYLETCGLLAGASTDPPALAFAHDVTNSDTPALTYASVYPLTTFMRIMVAQLLIVFFM
ncbi:putative transporter [Capnocytophaga canimorsus]|uniref:putative transporter n=1 Tax=Capnocytophaga canimorsus TaxID=28188 RepID=UPI000BB1B406|nr:putative transporter [Capnocytophaga canimorsus]ATA77114.1 potassium transporter TrkA [Capnocytophaga canimorsus]AWL78578.1 putative transporter [Capnocytophaga canimorsus]AYW37190.1 putative transporter [Capnocytophaga canimorsus]MDT9499937.1 putative transporter [Capnocytophaga canimorsus]PJI83744.1 putative transport protein [Capnocytophaga canimorsus]